MQPASNEVRVWDPLVRVGHWSLVVAFTVAYVTEDDLLTPHVWAGYVILGLVLLRILWGIVGTTHTRFSDLIYPPPVVLAYRKDHLRQRPARYLGHNPAGGLMIVALLLGLLSTSLTGLAAYAVEEDAGPLAGVLAGAPRWLAKALSETHEFFANLTLLLVALHVAGVLFGSWLHRENLIGAMITGRKRA